MSQKPLSSTLDRLLSLHKRLLRTPADGAWTVYIGGIYEKRSDGTYVKCYSAFGRRIAMRDSAGVVDYVLADPSAARPWSRTARAPWNGR